MLNQLTRYVLRTTAVEAAQRFYSRVLGRDTAQVVQLHEQAIARGAPPHWLGMIAVDSVDDVLERFVACGGQRLGPSVPMGNGTFATVLDPGGAVVGLVSDRQSVHAEVDIAWRGLNTNDFDRSVNAYTSIFGWQMREVIDLGADGRNHSFAYGTELPACGSIASIAGRRGVHPHWLFQFTVTSLDRAIAAVREGGGTVTAEAVAPSGVRVAVFDDPQGAAFALRQVA